jgi:sarcosine oxidase subunit beta
MSGPSVCVIGAGATGLFCALELARRGASVTVVEREFPASGSSGLSVGVIETQYLEPIDIEPRARAMRLFNQLERDHGLDITRTGYLRLARDLAGGERFADSVDYQHRLGLTRARVIEPDEIGTLVPDMNLDGIECGLWGPSDGFIDGHLYCALLAELASAAGAVIEVRSPLVQARRLPSGGYKLRTARGTVEADYVVNAAGAWAPQVAQLLGVDMPIRPQRHEAVVVHLARELDYIMPMVMDYTPHSGEIGLYFRHERPGQLIAGLHSEEEIEEVADPDAYAREASQDFLEGVAERLTHCLPGLADAGLAHGWAGLYPVSPDGVPQVGPCASDPRIVAAGGAGGSGIQLSPVIGELVADWILDGEPSAVSCGRALDPRRETLRGDRAEDHA